jgi:peptidyl-prolyl cis-trans isomerase D
LCVSFSAAQWKRFSFEDFRIKVSEVEKSGQGITSTAAATEYGIKRFLIALLTSEFDKLGLRVGEKHILEVLKADQNIGKIRCF